eukprot:g6757.t1
MNASAHRVCKREAPDILPGADNCALSSSLVPETRFVSNVGSIPVNLDWRPSIEYLNASAFDAPADLTFLASRSYSTKRPRSLDRPMPVYYPSKVHLDSRSFSTGKKHPSCIAGRSRVNQNDFIRSDGAVFGHSNVYMNTVLPSMTHLEHAPFPTYQGQQYFAPNVQSATNRMLLPDDLCRKQCTSMNSGVLMRSLPVYSWIPYPTLTWANPPVVFSGRPVEAIDESKGKFAVSSSQEKRSGSKRRENLPKQCTAVLKKWLVEHMLTPYPNNEDKMSLNYVTGLDISQINNWFINARVRIWKPIVSEVFKKFKDRIMEEASGDEHLQKRIKQAEKGTTMSIVSLLSSSPEARQELEKTAQEFIAKSC